MLNRLLGVTLIAALFFVSVQFICVFFYTFEFNDVVRDAVKYAPIRHTDKTGLTQFIREQAQSYGLRIDDIPVTKTSIVDSNIKKLAVDVNYMASIDLYYFTYPLQHQFHTSTLY